MLPQEGAGKQDTATMKLCKQSYTRWGHGGSLFVACSKVKEVCVSRLFLFNCKGKIKKQNLIFQTMYRVI